AQLGHGGFNTDGYGDYRGDIIISSANDLTFKAGKGESAYAQLGHGGFDADGSHEGAITISSANDLIFEAGTGQDAYAQLGHGGLATDGSHTGDIDITLVGGLTLTGVNTTYKYAMIGHGDEPNSNNDDDGFEVSGNLMLRVDGNADLENAFIGHQIDSDGTYSSGNTYVGVTGTLTTDEFSQFTSADYDSGTNTGELRIYLLEDT
ncbi:MAG: hypothetical protein GY829_16250, partial [Gammaproteobacteria bacterium]|nr:hypothetical protein [Gammaproteobacteria bacterium]